MIVVTLAQSGMGKCVGRYFISKALYRFIAINVIYLLAPLVDLVPRAGNGQECHQFVEVSSHV